MSSESNKIRYETIRAIELKHLPNHAKLLLQKQTGGKIPQGDIQFGLPSTFVNPDNGEDVWCNGPSIQLEQLPELIEVLTDAYGRYSGKDLDIKTTSSSSEKTNTFADVLCEDE